MQQHATQAYQTVAKRTGSPLHLEANLLSKTALNMQRIRENWDLAETELSRFFATQRRGGADLLVLHPRRLPSG